MTRRLIYVAGCDDTTSVALDLTDAEYEVAKRIAAEVSRRGGGCKPRMETASEGEGHYGWEDADDEVCEA